MPLLRNLGRLAGPLHILIVILTYMLGAGIAKYLGFPLGVPVLAMGLVVALLLQASMGWLADAFRSIPDRLREDEALVERAQVRTAALYAAIAALAASAAIVFALLRLHSASVGAALCLGVSIVVIIAYALPPLRGIDRGFGELQMAAQMAYLVPAVGFLLQAGSLHRLLNLCAIALLFLLVATLIALELPGYAGDLGTGRTTMLTKMGWERGIAVHHALILMTYLVLGLTVLMGFSFRLIGPAFLTMPFALLQVYLLQGIAHGAKPIWNLLRANSLALLLLTVYFLALSFWLR
jgi:1,4-dihydroxy-2-naphthoate octaprenyltransferase